MSVRLVEILCQTSVAGDIYEVISDHDIDDLRQQNIENDTSSIRFLLSGDNSKELLDQIDKRWSGTQNWRLILSPIQ
jgi:hypothetical protein